MKILLYPYATAAAIAMPIEADFPRPLAAVKETVLRRFFSEIASTNVIIAVAWSTVLAVSTKVPIG